MSFSSERRATLFAVVSLLWVGGCEYIEPVDVRLNFPLEGTFIEGDPLELTFTMPIRAETLSVSVWPDVRDVENELPRDAVPLLARCTVAASPCDGNTLAVAEDGLSATLVVDPDRIGKPDVPLLIEVHGGLVGENGARMGRPRVQDFQFKPAVVVFNRVDFDEGVYLFVSIFDEPLPNVITLMSDVKVSDHGRFLIVGAESDEVAGAAQSTRDPEELFIDTTDQGFVIFAEGSIRENDRGERFIETERFAIELRLGPLLVEIKGLRFTGIVIKNADTGIDQIQGTLSFEAIELSTDGNDPFIYDPGTTTFIADRVPEEHVPPGTPEICDDPCGAVPSQCDVPDPWPPAGFCGVPIPEDLIDDSLERESDDEDLEASGDQGMER